MAYIPALSEYLILIDCGAAGLTCYAIETLIYYLLAFGPNLYVVVCVVRISTLADFILAMT